MGMEITEIATSIEERSFCFSETETENSGGIQGK